MMIFRLGWRNLWRNSRRSWITLSAIATAYLFLIVMGGLSSGLTTQMLESGTELLLGHLQIHDAHYLPDRNLYDWIGADQQTDLHALRARLRQFPQVQGVTPRIYGFALLSTGEKSSGVQLIGVDPRTEGNVSTLLDTLISGRALSESPARDLLLGEALARSLGVEPGSELAVVTQSVDGTLGNDLYRVRGILRTGLAHLERSMALAHWSDLQELLVLDPSQVHELALRLEDPLSAEAVSSQLNASSLLPSGARAKSWGELLPQLKEYLDLSDGAINFMITLVGIFAGLGVLNTMMMAVFERTREIGTLSSLGMGPLRILSTFLVESFYLGLLGLSFGFLLGALSMNYLTTHGLDLTRWTAEISMLGSRMNPVMKAVWVWDQFLREALGLMAAVLLATLFPAQRAARMEVVRALRAPVET